MLAKSTVLCWNVLICHMYPKIYCAGIICQGLLQIIWAYLRHCSCFPPSNSICISSEFLQILFCYWK